MGSSSLQAIWELGLVIHRSYGLKYVGAMRRPSALTIEAYPIGAFILTSLTRWLRACAVQVEWTHGERAPVFVAERIGALALAGDLDGVEACKGIAARLDEMRAAKVQ